VASIDVDLYAVPGTGKDQTVAEKVNRAVGQSPVTLTYPARDIGGFLPAGCHVRAYTTAS
jgi:hypothetical protein